MQKGLPHEGAGLPHEVEGPLVTSRARRHIHPSPHSDAVGNCIRRPLRVPSPLAGEGQGEGEGATISASCNSTLPMPPSCLRAEALQRPGASREGGRGIVRQSQLVDRSTRQEKAGFPKRRAGLLCVLRCHLLEQTVRLGENGKDREKSPNRRAMSHSS